MKANMQLNHLLVTGTTFHAGEHQFKCAHGKGGFKADKREGDGATPLGIFALRQLLYRADRHQLPDVCLRSTPISPEDGWCDDATSKLYNLPVRLPFKPSHEQLWREDHAYDFIIPLGYNDAPPIAGKGSAIFLHLAQANYTPTEGCIALSLADMLTLLPLLGPQTTLEIRES